MLKATVKNNGTVDTDEVVQVYIKDLDSPLAVRNYSLCGFKRAVSYTHLDVYKRQNHLRNISLTYSESIFQTYSGIR